MKTITQKNEKKKKVFYRFTFAKPHTLIGGLAGWIYGDKLVTQATYVRLWSIFGLTRYKITIEYVTPPLTTTGDGQVFQIYTAGDNPLGRLLGLVLVLFSLSTVAHATPSSDLAGQAAYLRSQAAAASQNLHVARQQLDAAEQRLAGLQDKRTRQLEDWTVWNAGRCAVRGRLTLADAQSQYCKPAPKMVYYEQRPTGPEIVTPNPQRPLAQRAVAESTAVVEQGRAQLAAIEARLARVNADYQQALAATPPPPPPPPTPTPTPALNPHPPTVPAAVATPTEAVDTAPPDTDTVTVAAPATPPSVPPAPEETMGKFFGRHKGKIITGLVVIGLLAWMTRKPTA